MEPLYKINVGVKGIRSLLQNNSFETETKSKKGKKGQVYDPEQESKIRLITDNDGNICQKGEHFEGCLLKAASEFKFAGKKTYKDSVKSGIKVTPILIPFKQEVNWTINTRSVVVQRSRIPRYRPEIPIGWELNFTIECYDDRLESGQLKEIMEAAGLYYGIGDYRPKYGLFEITKWDVVDDTKISV